MARKLPELFLRGRRSKQREVYGFEASPQFVKKCYSVTYGAFHTTMHVPHHSSLSVGRRMV